MKTAAGLASTRTRAPFTGRRWAFALLAAFVFLLPGVARSDEDQALKKEIADVEQKIAQLRKKIDEIRKGPMGPAAPDTVPASVLERMDWRCIGPANMGGRVTSLAVVESNPTTYYIGTATGGLLKTVNNGTTFDSIFDNETTVSIGDVAVSKSNPDILYVGTGESNPRNSASYGDGVYKSTDGGKKWQNVGLKKSFSIGKVVIHPKNPEVVYVAAMGRTYGPSQERGIFKTEDGGANWKQVLFVNDDTGAIDLRMDPFDPDVLIAGLWERRRDEFDGMFGAASAWPGPDQYGPIVAHGPGGGLFKTSDGGQNWKKLTGEKAVPGLPTVKTGRIGLDYSRKTKGLVYAIIDTEDIGKGRPPLTVYLGITGEGEKGGAKLKTVLEDGPAGKAGLKPGDVVTKADQTKIVGYEELLDFMANKKPGDNVKLAVVRAMKDKKDDAENLTISMKLAPRPAEQPKGKGGFPGKGGPQGKGGGQQSLSPGGLVLAVDGIDGEVKVAVVPKGSAAEKAGVKSGMTIVGIDGKEVKSFRDYRTELRVGFRVEDPRKEGDKVKVAFKEGEKKGFDVELALEPAEMRFPGGIGGGGRGIPGRPFIQSTATGGQQVNVQASQGKVGQNTGGVYMSKDNGDTWTRVNSVNPRPFYFSQVRVDPTNDKTIYVLGDTTLWRSEDGGKQFASARANTVHADHHDLWINPNNGRHMIIGCDGGFYVTYDRGDNWDHINTQALGQFYHVAVDNRKPYRVYGGLQDNGSWGGPSRTLRGNGPSNEDWQFFRGGDGFVCRVDADDPDWVYAESQNGNMGRVNLKTGESKGIRPRQPRGAEALRFNWNTPFILSHHNSQIFYCGAQYVFQSLSRGDNLRPISPELTRTNKGSMTAIAESPKNAEVLWAGTDDGFLWVTKDGGEKWTNVTENLKKAGLPGYRWVATIEPARKTEGRCYVCLDAHRSDDDKPYLFVTDDFGATWKPITNNLPEFGSTRVLREDAVNNDILYCGTEFGIWVSLNKGTTWAKLNNNLPTVPVHEVAQPTTASEIVIATHGRSVWILDVASLRQMKPATLKDTVTFFTPATVTRWQYAPGGTPYSRDVRKFHGTNPPSGGSLDYLLTADVKELSLKITDIKGKDVPTGRTTVNGKLTNFRNLPRTAGFHRLQFSAPRPGTYRVVLTVDGKEHVQALTVENDPNAAANAVITDEPLEVPGGEEEEKGAGEKGEAKKPTPVGARPED